MDLAGVQNALRTMGVTLEADDDPPSMADALVLERQYRASLYLDLLQATQADLADRATVGVQQGDWAFVQGALARGALLNDLALSLDEWVFPAVERELLAVGAPSYTAWFQTTILTPAYPAPRVTFRTNHPIADAALTAIQQHFQANVIEAVGRIVADRAAIVRLFADEYPGLTLTRLTEIASSGSDFHKGGRQVLILAFAIGWYTLSAPRSGTLKLVYKPTDLEADCLLAGSSAAARAATNDPGYLAASLVELFNAQVRAQPAPGREELPTYRILPCNRTSTQAGPPQVRQAYGYIEFLYHEEGWSWSLFSFYLLGAGDFVIGRLARADPVVEPFYRQMGHLLALATTFSIVDMHVENVRVTRFRPHLIDLEVSLTSPTDQASATSLFGLNGGIDVAQRDEGVPYFAPEGGHWVRHQTTVPVTYANRLWAMRPGKRLVDVNAFWLLAGLQDGLAVLGEMADNGALVGWQARLHNVLVRLVPLATTYWNTVRSFIYGHTVTYGAANATLAPTVQDAQRLEVTTRYTLGEDPPRYVAVAAPQAAADLTAFDIPVFYHRIGTLDLLDSTGAVVPVPATVTIEQDDQPVQAPTGLGARTTYYAQSPTATTTLAQFTALANGGHGARFTALRQQVLELLRIDVPQPGTVVV